MAQAEEIKIREYLLGQLTEAEEEQVEMRLLTEPDFAEEYDIVVNEVTDDYIADKFDGEDLKQVEEHFFKSPARRNKLKFALALKQRKSEMVTVKGHQKRSYRPYLAIAATLLLVVGGFYVWRALSSRTELNRGLAALQSAFRDERPLEARVSDFGYAPYIATRGPGTEKIDQNELRRAELTLLEALKENPTPAAHHALGKVYLAKKDFDKAIEQFDQALKGDPKNAQLYSDLGAAWLEKGKIDREGKEPGKGMEELGRSLQNLTRALELDPNLLEGLFNRALSRQYLMLSHQAAEDWREYLKRDSSSPWAEEARRRLQVIEEEKNRKAKTGEELLQSFRAAYATRDEAAAWAAMAPGRARTGSVIVETLIDNHLALANSGRPAEAGSELDALEYAGECETEKSGDRYTATLSIVYRTATANQRANLHQARQLLKSGIDRYNRAEWNEAIQFFSEARDLFSRANDSAEALFADAWIGYTCLRVPDRKRSTEIFDRLSKTFEAKSYKSLFAQSLFAQADAVGRNEFSKVLEKAKQGLVVSEQIQDSANAVRCLQAGTSMQLILGNYRDSLAATFRALTLAGTLPQDPKLIWPFYHETSLDFYFLDMPAVALQFENEALRLALEANLPFQVSKSHDRLALLFEGQNKYAEALNNIEQSRAVGQKLSDPKSRANIRAHSALNLARLYRKTGDPRRAAESIDEALNLYQDLKLDMYQYAAHKEKLLDLIALNENDAAEVELDTVLSWFENNRKEIAEESYRNKFFDTGQSTYDLAIEFQISRKNDGWKAFDYAESARARSLLDLATTGGIATGDATNPELKISADSTPLNVQEIQKRLPPQTQLLEYSVLDDRVVIWLIGKDRKVYAEAQISRAEVNEKILNFLKALRSSDPSNNADITRLGKELFAKLIAPVESSANPALQLYIVPDDKLNFLPFGMLVSPATGKYLFEEYKIGTSPSATIFLTNSERASAKPKRGTEQALVVGGPQFDRERFANLEDLPAARREAEEVATLYGAAPLLGYDATTTRVRRDLQKVDIAHLATHAVPDEQTPLLSKLLFSANRGDDSRTHHAGPSFIQASEIYAMKLPRIRLVVLSACETGIERSYRGEGAIGLARPFMVAGAPLVIASLWQVESQASADLMSSFHRHRKKDHVSTVEALHRAQLEALHNSRSGAQRNYDWAAFVAIGGYASF